MRYLMAVWVDDEKVFDDLKLASSLGLEGLKNLALILELLRR